MELGSERRGGPHSQWGGRNYLRHGSRIRHILPLFSQIFAVLLFCAGHPVRPRLGRGTEVTLNPVTLLDSEAMGFGFRHLGNICVIVRIKPDKIHKVSGTRLWQLV